ncbi:hypothetical protein [Skermania piniformis]|uniref:Uncharacterized protein n=1 Tax=Skermania pinensis TaxID=39122 RepID=A0ABX8SBN3_9ACTN|nr:hypothetical protein [Skermania piniformis]QXQ15273.1 hypothetical protein KV203_08145 [Skermania piniformis]
MTDSRADRFVREMQELQIPDPAAGRARLWLRVGVILMVGGLVVTVVAYLMCHGTTDPLAQRDAMTLALGGIADTVIGSALFLRYSLTNFLRFWLARQSFDLAELASRRSEEASR